ncbi:hypothetical protein SDC9_55397 [bioreactor metagenome]|uniref:EamA domain-containing protein n=1 Tax=bioreactor metagenome TaxID=1076179 RepID=A0A644WZP9_9ZZZZ
MDPRRKAIAQMLVCASLWSIAGIFIKMIPWNPFVIAGWRSLIAAAAVSVYLLLTKVAVRFTKRGVLNGALMAATFLAFVTANKFTTAANAIVLQFTAPIFLMAFSALIFKERFRRGDFLAVFATMFGISLFFLDQLAPGYLLGNCIAILAGVFMAGMYLAMGSAGEDIRMGGMLLGHLFTAGIGIPVMFFTDTPVTAPVVGSILVLGVLQLGVPYILFALAVKHCPPLACSLLGAVEPLLNPLWVFLFDGEAPGFFALLGGVAVVASVTVWCIWKGKTAPAEPVAVPQ